MRKFYNKYYFLIHGIIVLFEFFICFQLVIRCLNLISPFSFEFLFEENPFFRGGILGGCGLVLFCVTFNEFCSLISALIKFFKKSHQDLE